MAQTGGMDIANGQRKRSVIVPRGASTTSQAGGVFFYLLRDEMEPGAYRKLMSEDKKRKTKEREERESPKLRS